MSLKKKLLIIAAGLLVLGGVAFAIGEVKTTTKPTPECVQNGQPSSGFAITKDDGTECKLASSSIKALRAYEWPPHKRPARVVAVGLWLAGIITGIVGLVVRPKQKAA